MRRLLILLLTVTLGTIFPLTLFAAGDRTDPLGGTGGGPINGTLDVRVVHDGTGDPFAGAFVMVGTAAGFPFPGNWGFASPAGEISFTHPDLIGPIMVTAGAPGYQYLSLVAVDANDLVIPLRPTTPQDPLYEVGDYVSGIDVDNGVFHAGDGNLDMALVLPTLRLEEMMSFDMEGLMGPPEIIEILGTPFEVASNFFIPQQWEVFIEIIKDHYYLYLPAGDYTLASISGRIPMDVVLEGGEMTEMLTALSWREIDILDVSVSGDTYDADLHVDPDLLETVTLNLSNVPEGSSAWCISVGDLDNRAGLGRLIPLGITAFECPAGSGPCGGSMDLTTTAAVGEFAGMAYFPVVAVNFAETNDMLVVTDREPHPRDYTEDIGSFFSTLDLGYSAGEFVWNDVENPGNGSPDVDVQIARVESAETEEVYWEFMIPRDVHSFTPPDLPPEAPPGPTEGGSYAWEQMALGLTYDLASFDFNDFAFSDIVAHGSHLAIDEAGIVYGHSLSGVANGATIRGLRMQGGIPNPFWNETTIRFELPAPADVDLSIYTVGGREVTNLIRGQRQPGEHRVTWRGRDATGRSMPTGLYLARIRVDGRIASRSLMLLK